MLSYSILVSKMILHTKNIAYSPNITGLYPMLLYVAICQGYVKFAYPLIYYNYVTNSVNIT